MFVLQRSAALLGGRRALVLIGTREVEDGSTVRSARGSV